MRLILVDVAGKINYKLRKHYNRYFDVNTLELTNEGVII
jgi:hypothetical protein